MDDQMGNLDYWALKNRYDAFENPEKLREEGLKYGWSSAAVEYIIRNIGSIVSRNKKNR